MSKVKMNPYKADRVRFAILNVLEDSDKIKKIIDEANKKEDYFEFDIDLKINGIELDFMKLVNRIIDSENEIVAKKVKEIISDKFVEISNKADEIIDNLEYLKVEVDNITN